MRRALVATASLTLLACQPTYVDTRAKYLTEIVRADKATREIWKQIDTAEVPAGACARQDLTHAVRGYDEASSSAGNTELVSYLTLTLYYDKPRWDREVLSLKLGSRLLAEGPLVQTANAARHSLDDSPAEGRVYKGLVPTIEASRAVTHLLVVRGEGTSHFEVFLFDVEKQQVACGFAVDGEVSAGVEDRDVTVVARGGSYASRTDDEAASRLANARWRLNDALRLRFGLGLDLERHAPPAPTAPLPAEVLTARARLGSMYEQREAKVPPCTALPEGTQRIEMETLRWAAEVTTPPELAPFQRSFGEGEMVARMLNGFNPASSKIEGAKGFLAMKSLQVFEPVRFEPPRSSNQGWSAGRLQVRGLVFQEGKLTCSTTWDLVTPDDLKVGLKNGRITEQSAKDGAAKNLAQQFQLIRLPL